MKHKFTNIGLTVIFLIRGLIIGLITLCGLWTDKNLDFWASYIKGSEVDIPLYLSFIVTLVFNVVVIMANIVAEIAKFLI